MILETERLILRKFTLEDVDFIIELLNTEGWLKYIGDRNVRTKEQAIAYLQNGPLTSYKEIGYGLSMVETKADHQPVGMCGILNRKTLDTPDIGFAFLPSANGKGYAYEIASAVTDHARKELKIPELSAITIPGNERSIRLLTRLGFRFLNSHKSESGEELSLYRKNLIGV